MSSGELLLIVTIALLVFGPSKLPMLATHLGILLRKINQIKEQMATFWQQQVQEHQLQNNQKLAEQADTLYRNKHIDLHKGKTPKKLAHHKQRVN